MRSGTSARQIAEKGLVGRRKANEIAEIVRAKGWENPFTVKPTREEITQALDRGSPVPTIPSKLEPHREEVQQLVNEGYQPSQIHRHLKNKRGLNASVGAVKRFLKKLQKETPKGFVVLHFEAGEDAQVDFGTGPVLIDPATGKAKRTHVFVMTLCHSRHQYAEIVWDQKVGTWLSCHRNAFEFFGGVPLRVTIDNLKSAITKACATDPVVQRAYEELARGYEFQICPCRPRTPEHKGRVEAGVKYFKSSFLPLREFRGPGLQDANKQLINWVNGEAGNRVHGTTAKIPLSVFVESERAALKPLPLCPPETVVWAKAKLHKNCHLTYEGSYYSAPYSLIDRELELRITDRTVEILDPKGHRVGFHPRALHKGHFETNPAHYPPEKAAYLEKTPEWCLEQAQKVGQACHAIVQALLGDQVVGHRPAARRLVGLTTKYLPTRLELACQRAVSHGAMEYQAVRRILEKGLDQETPPVVGQPCKAPFISSPRFQRGIGQMMAVGF
jgi:transposase